MKVDMSIVGAYVAIFLVMAIAGYASYVVAWDMLALSSTIVKVIVSVLLYCIIDLAILSVVFLPAFFIIKKLDK